jgi:catechol 2,3-dioxygenase-like lactoylglutathione lyase family enzyme
MIRLMDSPRKRGVVPQPLLAVRDVPASSRWYQNVLGAESGHGGDEYERLVVGDQPILQLHAIEEDHHHGGFATPGVPLGNGVAVWFEVEELDAAIGRIRKGGATVVTDVHVNPNAGHREIWLRDPDGYLVVLAGR